MKNKGSKIGELLLQAGAITPPQLEEALEDQKRYGGRLATILFEKCHITEVDYLRALESQFAIKSVDLTGRIIPEQVLKLVPSEVALKFNVLPYGLKPQGGRQVVLLAMSDPTDLETIDTLQALTKKNFEPALALESAIRFILHDYYFTQKGNGDYLITPEIHERFCEPGKSFLYEIETPVVREGHAPDPFHRGEELLLREGGEEWAQQISGRVQSAGRLSPELKALIELLVYKGIISWQEYEERRKKLTS